MIDCMSIRLCPIVLELLAGTKISKSIIKLFNVNHKRLMRTRLASLFLATLPQRARHQPCCACRSFPLNYSLLCYYQVWLRRSLFLIGCFHHRTPQAKGWHFLKSFTRKVTYYVTIAAADADVSLCNKLWLCYRNPPLFLRW